MVVQNKLSLKIIFHIVIDSIVFGREFIRIELTEESKSE